LRRTSVSVPPPDWNSTRKGIELHRQAGFLQVKEKRQRKQLLAAEALLGDDVAFLAQTNQVEYRFADVRGGSGKLDSLLSGGSRRPWL
jgi:hypothetical protein